jgi:hypothetical protein
MKDREFHSLDESEEAMNSLLRTFRASSPTGCAAFHRSWNMKENIFLNKTKWPLFWVDMEIGRGAEDFLYTMDLMDEFQTFNSAELKSKRFLYRFIISCDLFTSLGMFTSL